MAKWTRIAIVAPALLAMAACSGSPEPAPSSAVGWQAVVLPAPPGPAGRVSLRDAVTCGGKWFVVGAVVNPPDPSAQATAGAAAAEVSAGQEITRPVAWTSDDGRTWTSLTVDATSFYGKQDVLYSAGCRDGHLAVIGDKSGGSHGNPRVSTFYQDGTRLVEVDAAFTLFGGSEALNVGQLTGGPKGWLIAGNRVSGGAAWISTDARQFQLIEGSPGLASDPGLDTFAAVGLVTDTGWELVGGGQVTGHIDRDPFAWSSDDGTHWRRQALPHDTTYEDLQRVARVGSDVVAVGLHGGTFGAWVQSSGTWRVGGRFGATDAQGLAAVSSATAVGARVVVASQDGKTCALWVSSDHGASFVPVNLPGRFPAGADSGLAVAGDASQVLLVGDDGVNARLWTGHFSG